MRRERRCRPEAVIHQFQFDHGDLHALGGSDEWWNLYPMLTAPHREKSKADTAIVAKVRRSSRKTAAHKAAMEVKAGIASAPQPKSCRMKRTIGYRKASGEVVPSRVVPR